MQCIKPLLTLALCLIVIATSATQAIARSQMAAGQMVQLCAGGEAVTVMVDAQGNPVGPDHSCPDCIAVVCGLPPVAFGWGRPQDHTTQVLRPEPGVFHTQSLLRARARGPPVLI